MIKETVPPQRYSNHKCVEPKIKASKCMKKKLADLKGLINKSTILAGDFNTLSVIDRPNRKKVSRNKEEWTTPSAKWIQLIFIELSMQAAKYTLQRKVENILNWAKLKHNIKFEACKGVVGVKFIELNVYVGK